MKSSVPETSNDAWLVGLKSGSHETTALLRTRIRTGLGAALAQRSDVHDADLDDFTQDAVVRVLERLDTFRGDSRFTTWAMAVAIRVSLTALRRRRRFVGQLDERFDRAAQGADQPESAGEHGELIAALRTAIDTALTPRQREVLLAELAGLPQVVLAERMSSTAGAIYKVSHDARKKLKAALAQAGFDADTVRQILARDNQDASE